MFDAGSLHRYINFQFDCLMKPNMNQTISIKYFSILSEITGKRQEKLSIHEGDTLEDILLSISKRFPEIEKYHPHVRAAVNQNYEEFDFKPKNNDEIVFITPVSGG